MCFEAILVAGKAWQTKIPSEAVSATIDIRRNGDEWIIEDGSARIRTTKPSGGIIERFVDQREGMLTGKRLTTSSAPSASGKCVAKMVGRR